jgi:SAM-dependent methyltransferase
MKELQEKWDRRHCDSAMGPPLGVLTDYAHLLPRSGAALDLACGLGASAVFLARSGLQTTAWDLSPVAIERLQASIGELPLQAAVRDVVSSPPPANRFDVICVGHFLERDLCPVIARALKPGGLLFYQTFGRDRIDDSGPSTDRFRLATNELLKLFDGLVVRVYREEGQVGDHSKGVRNIVQLVAQQVR